MHFHYELFAEIVRDLAKTVASLPETDVAHRAVLREAAEALAAALQARQQSGTDDTAGLTPQEEVRLLHIME